MTNRRRLSHLSRLHRTAARGEAIVGGRAGNLAAAERASGADLIVLPGTCREQQAVLRLAGEIVQALAEVPVLAGIGAVGPDRMDRYLDVLLGVGVAGVYCLADDEPAEPSPRAFAEKVGTIAMARGKGLLASSCAFSEVDAVALAIAGADIIVCDLGRPTSTPGGKGVALGLSQCLDLVGRCADAALAINPDTVLLVRGGPVEEPRDAAYIMDRVPRCHGVYDVGDAAGSRSLEHRIRMFKSAHLR